jgi:hypothetical protein
MRPMLSGGRLRTVAVRHTTDSARSCTSSSLRKGSLCRREQLACQDVYQVIHRLNRYLGYAHGAQLSKLPSCRPAKQYTDDRAVRCSGIGMPACCAAHGTAATLPARPGGVMTSALCGTAQLQRRLQPCPVRARCAARSVQGLRGGCRPTCASTRQSCAAPSLRSGQARIGCA